MAYLNRGVIFLVKICMIIYLTLFNKSRADPKGYTQEYIEGQIATLNCSEILYEELEITSVNYFTPSCQHSDVFGIANLCNGKRSCSFNVTNTNVGSRCGAEAIATLHVTFKCIRHGGWSEWNPRTCRACDGLYVNATRTCNNPSPNKYGSQCEGDSTGEIPCDQWCTHTGSQNTCTNTTATFSCLIGYINVDGANWLPDHSCVVPAEFVGSKDVGNVVSELCTNRTSCTFQLADSTFDVQCAQCTSLSYGYRCQVAHWSQWSYWSDCTTTCGKGTRTRSRECLGSLVTSDNTTFSCAGDIIDQSSCVEDACPYCPTDDKSNLHLNAATVLKDISEGTSYIQMDDIYTISCCARLASWTFLPVNPGILTLFILRKTIGQNYSVVGTNNINVSDSDLRKIKTYNVSENKSIGIIKGDIIGWFDNGSNIIGYTDCNDNMTCPRVARLKLDNVDNDITMEGLTEQHNRTYQIYYSTPNNRIPEFFLDEINAIPDHSEIDSIIGMVRTQDPDIGDYIQNYEIEYSNRFVYFDTKLRSLYVKSKLPHKVGQNNISVTYKLAAMDSCGNRNAVNITVTAYNVPPMMRNIPRNITVDKATIDVNKPFMTFAVTDPPGDNITCAIEDSDNGSTTDQIILVQDSNHGINDLSLFFNENYFSAINMSRSSLLEITCSDGTDTSKAKLYVNFILGIHVNADTSGQDKTSMIIPVVVPIIVVLVIICVVVVACIFIEQKRKFDDRTMISDIVEYTKEEETRGKRESHLQNTYVVTGGDVSKTNHAENQMKEDDPSNAYNPAWR